MSLTKYDIAADLSQELNLQQAQAREIVDDFFDTVRDLLAEGHDLHLSGFGNFTLRNKKERPGRNPLTGEEVLISARRVVGFHVGQKLKARLQDR